MIQRQPLGLSSAAWQLDAEMRSLEKGPAPTQVSGAPVAFVEYRDAVVHLKSRLGRYCSYCERTIPVGLAVEHKRPKDQHPHLALEWRNFLLACSNCNSSKANRDPLPGSVLWPDEDDTFSSISYHLSGRVQPAPNLDSALVERVAATLSLLGLSKAPNESASSDHRHFDRLEVWRKALQSKEDLFTHDGPALRRSIIETAKSSGGYSIWQTVFASDTAMQIELAANFPGTRRFASPL